MLDLGLAEDGLHDNLEDLLVDLESISLRLVEAILGEKLAVADEHCADLGHLAVHVVWCDLVELQTNLLVFILGGFGCLNVRCGLRLHLVFKVVLLSAPLVVVDKLRLGRKSLETALTVVTTATTVSSATTIIVAVTTVMITTATTTIAATDVLACRSTHPVSLFVDKRLIFTVITTSDNSAMDTLLDQILRKLDYILHLADKDLEQIDGHFTGALDLVDSIFHLVDASFVVRGDLVALDISFRALLNSLEKENRLFLGRINGFDRHHGSWLGTRRHESVC